MTGLLTVHRLAASTEAVWDFHTSAPTWRHPTYAGSATFDPFPAYPHDIDTAATTALAVQERVPPLWNVELFIADREEVGRSNGFSSVHQQGHHDEDGKWTRDDPVGIIMLSGKRIMPHPAMTRYLVGHEYGHHVEWMLNHARGSRHLQDNAVVRDYAQMRGLPPEAVHHGSGGRWHDSVDEIFACDFRLVVCALESEFWPHPDVPRPEDVPGLRDWWEKALADLAAAHDKPFTTE